MPGFQREILIDEKVFHDRLLCVICKLILRDAVQSTCGHRCCESCVKDKLARRSDNGAKAICPACQPGSEDSILKEGQIYPDFHARKELKNLKVKCCNEGCRWTGTFEKFTIHESECEVAMIKCLKAGCGKSLRRVDLAYHLDKDCPMRPVKCRNCGIEVAYKDMKKHNSECPKINVSCGDCGQKMSRDQLQAHQNFDSGDCPNKKQNCAYAYYGCTFTVTGTGMKEHLQNEIVYHTQLQKEKFDEIMELGRRLLQSQNVQVVVQSEMSTGSKEASESDEGACAIPRAQSVVGTSKLVDQLVPIFKQFFITRDEQDRTEPNNQKKSEGSISSSKTGKSAKQVQGEAVDKRVRNLESKAKEGDQELENMRTLYAVLDKRNETFQEVVAVLNNQLEALAGRANTSERQNRHLQDTIEQQDKQINAQDQMLTVKNVALAEQELRIQSLEASAYNGILVWKISEFARRRRDAVSGKTTSFYSPAFYTSYHGYKMCARIYLNGDGMGKGTHISLFFVVMKGRYDNIIHWPFRQKVTFMMVDQGNREHVVDSFRPDPTSSSFKKPTHEMNIASGCPLFVNLNLLESENHSFVKDDCIFVKVIVDVSDLERT